MRRREFIAGLAGSAAWPVVARAQQPAMPVIGFLHGGEPGPFAYHAAALRKGLEESGYVEGQNLAIEYRWAEQHSERATALAADLVQRRVAVIATGGGSAMANAAKAATASIPIVFTTGTDPVEAALVPSLNRPGGNVTGVMFFGTSLGAKPMELLHEVVPQATNVAVLTNPSNPNTGRYLNDLQAGARTLGTELRVLNVNSERDVQIAFASLTELGVHALVVGGDPVLNGHRALIVALAARYAVPTIYSQREYVVAGGLMSYGTSQTDAYRNAGVYTGRILKGTKPADLPVLQPTRFEFVINLKTTKALGLTIPERLLATADEVIE